MKLAGFIMFESWGFTNRPFTFCANSGLVSLFCFTRSMYILQFDGMLHTSGSPRIPVSLLGYGWILQRNGMEIARGYGLFLRKCKTGSNIAEYLALINGLDALIDLRLRHESVEIRGDAKCVIDQMIGYAGVSSPLTKDLNRRARKLARRFTTLTWVWVPRHENRRADSLSRRSFNYLHYSPHLNREINMPQGYFSDGRLLPLVDLRVHTPTTQAGKYLPD